MTLRDSWGFPDGKNIPGNMYESDSRFKSKTVHKSPVERRNSRLLKLYQLQSGLCFFCQQSFSIHQMNIDHLQPKSRRGSNAIGNLVASCYLCNNQKADRLPSDKEKLRKLLLNQLQIAVEALQKIESDISKEALCQIAQLVEQNLKEFRTLNG